RLDLRCVQAAHHFQTGKHSIDSVKLTPMRLSIEMAPGGDRRSRRISPGASSVDVAHCIELYFAPCITAPADELVAATLVVAAQRSTAAAAIWQPTNLPHVHER